MWDLAENSQSTTIGEIEQMLPFEVGVFRGLLIERAKKNAQ